MKTHYDTLGVRVGAGPEEIRNAYRQGVKRAHPDLNQGDPRSLERMKALVTAWEVLGDPDRRLEYDRIHSLFPDTDDADSFRYPDFLRSRTGDPVSRAKLIFYDLLNDNPVEALELYDSFVAAGDLELSRYIGREDFMDCAFLLAEEFEHIEDYTRAYALLSTIVRFEEQRPYFRHFMQEVYERLRTMVCFKMQGQVETDFNIRCLIELIGWPFARKDIALFYKRKAELHLENGDRQAAARALRRAVSSDERIGGIKKLQQELGYFEPA